MRYSGVAKYVLSVAVIGVAKTAMAGPPYLTDDPEPVPLHHWEAYAFMTSDRADGTTAVTGPAIEINNGVAPNTQLHMVVPETFVSRDGVKQSGFGDMEAGVKYRFLSETKNRPEAGVFPLAEMATGDSAKGLGNGRTWAKFPLWIQKSWGPWTSYGGGGYAYNPAEGQRDYWYSGALLQRTVSARLTLGGELFWQGAQANAPSPAAANETAGARSSSLWNVGGSYNFTPDFSLLFTVGHSFQGDGNAVMYLGLYRTWGPGSP